LGDVEVTLEMFAPPLKKAGSDPPKNLYIVEIMMDGEDSKVHAEIFKRIVLGE